MNEYERARDQLQELMRKSLSMLTALREDGVQMPYSVFRAHEHLAASLEECRGPDGAISKINRLIDRLTEGKSGDSHG